MKEEGKGPPTVIIIIITLISRIPPIYLHQIDIGRRLSNRLPFKQQQREREKKKK